VTGLYNTYLQPCSKWVSNNEGASGKQVNPIFYDNYRKKISEGKTAKQELKAVMMR
jgi:hypothetical protein